MNTLVAFKIIIIIIIIIIINSIKLLCFNFSSS
jgi:hypothetical protein